MKFDGRVSALAPMGAVKNGFVSASCLCRGRKRGGCVRAASGVVNAAMPGGLFEGDLMAEEMI